jgi:succinate-semialdehyde dehydrogenase/glutarate-semialdehyde dehydrogenase
MTPLPWWINLHKDIKNEQQADQIDSGMIFINEPTTTQPDLPLEEKVQVMVELSELGIHEFVNKKLIRVAKIAKYIK